MQVQAVGAVPSRLGEEKGADARAPDIGTEIELFEQFPLEGRIAEELCATDGDEGVTLRQHDLPYPAGDLLVGTALGRQVGHGGLP